MTVPRPCATHDEERGPRSTVPGPTVYDQDDPIVGASGLPVVESMPRRPPSGTPRRAHAVSKPTRLKQTLAGALISVEKGQIRIAPAPARRRQQ